MSVPPRVIKKAEWTAACTGPSEENIRTHFADGQEELHGWFGAGLDLPNRGSNVVRQLAPHSTRACHEWRHETIGLHEWGRQAFVGSRRAQGLPRSVRLLQVEGQEDRRDNFSYCM